MPSYILKQSIENIGCFFIVTAQRIRISNLINQFHFIQCKEKVFNFVQLKIRYGHAEWREEQAQMTAKNLYEQGLTIEQIARAIGFSMDTVEKWLTQKAG